MKRTQRTRQSPPPEAAKNEGLEIKPQSLELSPRITWGLDLCSLEPPPVQHWSPTWSRAPPTTGGQEASAAEEEQEGGEGNTTQCDSQERSQRGLPTALGL